MLMSPCVISSSSRAATRDPPATRLAPITPGAASPARRNERRVEQDRSVLTCCSMIFILLTLFVVCPSRPSSLDAEGHVAMTFRTGVSPAPLFVASTECSSRHWETQGSSTVFLGIRYSNDCGGRTLPLMGNNYG